MRVLMDVENYLTQSASLGRTVVTFSAAIPLGTCTPLQEMLLGQKLAQHKILRIELLLRFSDPFSYVVMGGKSD